MKALTICLHYGGYQDDHLQGAAEAISAGKDTLESSGSTLQGFPNGQQ
jgi:hypothetical protein